MSSYYDPDDILAEEEIVSTIFQKPANGVGILDPSAETNNVEQGSKVDLPLWLAHELNERQTVLIKTPVCFNHKTRKEIQADAACVDLRNRCRYFYEFGCKIVQSIGDRTIGSLLLVAFRSRYKEVLTKAHTTGATMAPKLSTLLTKEETYMFDTARNSMNAFKKWRVGGPRFQRASILGRKRKSTG